jgi:hypothetical protein
MNIPLLLLLVLAIASIPRGERFRNPTADEQQGLLFFGIGVILFALAIVFLYTFL